MTTDEAAAIADAVDERREEIVDLLCDLVRIQTPTPPGDGYGRIVDRLLPEFADLGFVVERVDLPQDVFEARCSSAHPELHGARANLTARLGTTAERVGVYCHLDTVPVGDPAAWASDPFEPQIRDGFVFGRGAADSKAGAAAILSAFRVLARLGIEPRVEPIVALTTDEEMGGYSGLMYLADTGVFDGCRLLHSCDGPSDSIGIGALGAFTWTIRVKGKSVHSGKSFLGVNPIERSLGLLTEIAALKRRVDARAGALAVTPEMTATTGRTVLQAVINVTIARGGVKHNIVPSEFVIEGDRRLIPEEDEQECIAELREAVDRARAADPLLDCDLEVWPFYPSFNGDARDPVVGHVRQTVERATGRSLPLSGGSGSTDVAYVARSLGIPATMFGVAGIETRNHGVDERCPIDGLLAVTRAVALLMAKGLPAA